MLSLSHMMSVSGAVEIRGWVFEQESCVESDCVLRYHGSTAHIGLIRQLEGGMMENMPWKLEWLSKEIRKEHRWERSQPEGRMLGKWEELFEEGMLGYEMILILVAGDWELGVELSDWWLSFIEKLVPMVLELKFLCKWKFLTVALIVRCCLWFCYVHFFLFIFIAFPFCLPRCTSACLYHV